MAAFPILRPLPLLVAACLGGTTVCALAENETTTQVYQQRAADGRVVLTDRPSAQAVTERTWLIEREDPAAAQQRALEVRREADAVSERIRRSLESQERQASESEFLRLRLAQLDRAQESAERDDRASDVVLVLPGRFRHHANHHPARHRAPPMARPMPPRWPSFRGSAWPESR